MYINVYYICVCYIYIYMYKTMVCYAAFLKEYLI